MKQKRIEITKHKGDAALIGQQGTVERVLTSFRNPVYIVKLDSGREVNLNAWNFKYTTEPRKG